jgi:hypothetical protein
MGFKILRSAPSPAASLNCCGQKAPCFFAFYGRTGRRCCGVEANAFHPKGQRWSFLLHGGAAFASALTLVLHPCKPSLAQVTDDPDSAIHLLPVSTGNVIPPAQGVTPILPEDTDQATLDDLLSQAMSYLRGASLNHQASTDSSPVPSVLIAPKR